jgi:hypothetical protein
MKLTYHTIAILLFLPITATFIVFHTIFVFYKFVNTLHPDTFFKVEFPKEIQETITPNNEIFVRTAAIIVSSTYEFFIGFKDIFNYKF